jgi:hypothetical protein
MALMPTLPGQQGRFLARGFFTSDDGPLLYTYLDAFFDAVIGRAALARPEDIDVAFMSIVEGTSATLIVNPPVVMQVIAKVPITAGQPVHLDQVADVASVTIPGFTFPERGALGYIFQHGWRRGFYFDLTAHTPGADMGDTLPLPIREPDGRKRSATRGLRLGHRRLPLPDRIAFSASSGRVLADARLGAPRTRQG